MKAILIFDGYATLETDNMFDKKYLIYVNDIKGNYISTEYAILKPLPEKKASIDDGGFTENFYAEGWNDCIDEILGEEE